MSSLEPVDAWLAHREELFCRLFADSPIGVAIVHPTSLQVLKANRVLCQMLGYTEAELVEQTLTSLTHPDDLKTEWILIEQMRRSTIETYTLEKRFLQKNGNICWGNLSVSGICNAVGEVVCGLGMVENISDRKRIEAAHEVADNAYRKSEERFFKAFQLNPIASAITSFPEGRLLDANDAYLQLLGYKREEAIGHTTLELNFWSDLKVRQQLLASLHNQVAIRDMEITYCTREGTPRYGIIFLEQIEINGCPCLLTMLYDITDRKQAEIALHQQAAQEQLLRAITQRMRQSLDLDTMLDSTVEEVGKTLQADRVLIFRLRLNGGSVVLKESVLPAYPASANMGWEKEWFPDDCHDFYLQGIPRVVANIETDDWGSCLVEFMQSMQVKSKIVAPIIERHNGSSRVWGLLIVHACSFRRQWQPAEACFLQQIANQLAIALQQADLYQRAQQELFDRKQVEEQLLSSLQEKEVLLKEIHHRVKNNLQIISSLLRMQARQAPDDQTTILFQEAQNRVQSMALIHEQLYQSPDLAQIDFGEYLNALVSNLFHSYGIQSSQIALEIETSGYSLNLNTAIPCGLIINELVSNGLKYAFPNGQPGKVQINFQAESLSDAVGMQQGILTVADNGVGFPEDINWQTTRSLGLRIVRNLVLQLGGSLTLDRTCGSQFRIVFPATLSIPTKNAPPW